MTTAQRSWSAASFAVSLVLAACCFQVARVLAELDDGALPLGWVALGLAATGLFPAVVLVLRRDQKAALVGIAYVAWVLPPALVLLLAQR